jgi:hypothetical protein
MNRFSIVFPIRGINGFFPGWLGKRSHERWEHKAALKALKDHGLAMHLIEYKMSEDESSIIPPAYLVRLDQEQPRHDGQVCSLQKVTVEKLGVPTPLYTGKNSPQGHVQDIIEMPQVEMWTPFSDVFIRLSAVFDWPLPEYDD